MDLPAVEKFARPIGLNGPELAVIAILVAVSLGLGWYGVDRKVHRAHRQFAELAPRISQALQRFAADHGGRFPPAVSPTKRPSGLSDKYIRWNPKWGVVYDVRRNRQGGRDVCLELLVPNIKSNFRRLCLFPRIKKRHGRGQPIKGTDNRLWVVATKASVMGSKKPSPSSR